MHFKFNVTIPANTSQDAPYRKALKVTKGTITQVGYFFIPDCAGYVGLRILHLEHVVWPTNPGEWYVRNEGGEPWPESYELDALPYQLVAEAYNEDDTYDHDVEVSFALSPKEETLVGMLKSIFTPSRRVELEL